MTAVGAPRSGLGSGQNAVRGAEPRAAAPASPAGRADRDRQRITAALALPVLALSLVPALEFDHWQWLCMALTAPVATWGAWPYHRAALADLGRGSGSGHTVVSLSVLAAFGWSLYALYGTGAGEPGNRIAFSAPFGDTARDTAGAAVPVYFAVAAGVPSALLWLRRAAAAPGRGVEGPARERIGVIGVFVPGTVAVAAVTLGFWLGAGAGVPGAAGAAVAVLVGAGPCVLGLVAAAEDVADETADEAAKGAAKGAADRAPDRLAAATALACTAVGLPLAVTGRLGSLQAGLLVLAGGLLAKLNAVLNNRREQTRSAGPAPDVQGHAEYVLLPARLRALLMAGGAAAACVLLLAAFTGSGAAGRPTARSVTVEVTDARILLPTNPDSTAALFTLHNPGTSDDILELVSSPDLGSTMLTRTEVAGGAGRMRPVASVTVPAGGSVRMSPYTLDVMVADPPALEAGTRVRFDLWFREGGRVRVEAVTVPPGS